VTAVKLGQAPTPLRDQGALILASGSMTHNLYDFRQSGAQPADYVQEFTAWVHIAVLARGTDQLINYCAEAPHAERVHPSEEHFLPLLVAMGATLDADEVNVLHGGVNNGALSMESYPWGLNDERAL
jgi:4,5-DOPA dioxygenase extradiol